ncbi:MAG: phosphocholine cytidylyltransferase family protein [Woeseiaceae bacterium]|nr:phosphocholine cytidylyltransferase family protein [Woeseiaceae bacterium]
MTRALILAAGEGQRLRPLTNERPKCLVPLLGKPMLLRQLDVMKRCGVSEIEVITGFCAGKIEELGLSCSHNADYAQTNMVTTLFSARQFIDREGDLLIAYGDIVYEQEVLQAILDCDDDVCVVVDQKWRKAWELRFDDPLSDAETMLIDADGYITELGKKPESYAQIQGQYIGLIKISGDRIRALIDFYDSMDRSALFDGKDFANMYMTSFLQALIDAEWKVRAVPIDGGWLEVDSVDDLQMYERLHASGQLADVCTLD